MSIRLGIIADDVTGATDVASLVAREGPRVVQVFGPPGGEPLSPPDCDVLVVALKSRSIPAEAAVSQSLRTAQWLLDLGVPQLYFKYCSTFDSTPDGNIGPVLDALAELTHTEVSLVAPSSPANGRTVFMGHLFVEDQLLENSPLRQHPINPMTRSDLRVLIEEQGSGRAGLIPWESVKQGESVVRARLLELAAEGVKYAIGDAITDEDLMALGAGAGDAALLSGAAGLAAGLARTWGRVAEDKSLPPCPATPGAIVSGSCSARTREQVARHALHQPSLYIDPARVMAGMDLRALVEDFLADVGANQLPLIYTTAEPESVRSFQEAVGLERAAAFTEEINGQVASILVESGRRRLVLAGGETAGAAIERLHIDQVAIGPEVAAGVPWVVTTSGEPLAMVLKSGNFGSPDMFSEAFSIVW